MLSAKLYRDGVITETTDAALTSMRHGIIDPDCSVRELLKNYADRLEIAIRREKEEAAAAANGKAGAKEDGCPGTGKLGGLAKVIDMPEIGLKFDRIRSDGITYFIGKWKNDQYSHVYSLRVEKWGGGNGHWIAIGENDGRHIFTINSPSRQLCEKLGFAALRKYIRIGHRRTLKSLKRQEETKMHGAEDVANGPAA